MKTKTKKPKQKIDPWCNDGRDEPGEYNLTQEQKDYVDKAYKEGRILAEEIDLSITSKEDLLDALKNSEKLLQNQQRTIAALKDQVASLQHDWNMCDSVCDDKQLEIQRLKRELKNTGKNLLIHL